MSSAATNVQHPEKYRFGDFELSPKQAALWRDGIRVPLMPKPMATLIVLVERAGQTVSKDELLDLVWNGAAVEDNNVSQTISALRKALGEKRGENRFIATDPGSGYRFVADVTAIDAPPVHTTEISPNESPHRRRWWLPVSVAILLLCLISAGAIWMRKAPGIGPMRKSVAILAIRNLSKTSSEGWLQTALPEMLTSELASGGRLHTIPSGDVAQWRSGLGDTFGSLGDTGLVRSAHRNFGADDFILGSYVVTGSCPDCRVRVDLGVFDAHTGDSMASIIDEGSAQDLLDLTTRLGAKLRADLGAGGSRAEPSPWPAASAMREYAEGLKALRSIDPMAARDHLEAAATADPGNALIHAALADAWTSLGYTTRAKEESRRAYELSPSLSRLDQLAIEARYRATAQQWDRAIEIDRSIFQLFPDSLEDGLNLAQAQYRGMKNAEARSTLTRLRQLPKPAGNDPRIDLLEARITGTETDFAKTRDLARRAAEEAKSRGAMYLFARARLLEGGAMQTVGDTSFFAVQSEARKICEQLGDRQCVSQAWRIHGNERFGAGSLQEAQDAYQKGVLVARELGDRAELANLLNGLGSVSEARLEWSPAERNFQEAVALKKETGYNSSEETLQLAELYLRSGRLPETARALDSAYTESQKTNSRAGIGEVFLFRASLARLDGRIDVAQQLEEQAVAELRAAHSTEALIYGLANLSSIVAARGDLTTAGKLLADADSANFRQNTTIYPASRGAIELARAELLLAQAKLSDAADQAKRAAADFSNAHRPEDSARALVIEADALDRTGKSSEARQISDEAAREAVKGPDPFAIASARLASWRLGAGSNPNEPAELRSSIARLHNPELALEEQLARAVLVKRSGAPNAGRLLDSVANRAASSGYITLSRRARSLE